MINPVLKRMQNIFLSGEKNKNQPKFSHPTFVWFYPSYRISEILPHTSDSTYKIDLSCPKPQVVRTQVYTIVIPGLVNFRILNPFDICNIEILQQCHLGGLQEQTLVVKTLKRLPLTSTGGFHQIHI